MNKLVGFTNLHSKSRVDVISTLFKLLIAKFASVEVNFRRELANFLATFVSRTRSIAKTTVCAGGSFCSRSGHRAPMAKSTESVEYIFGSV